MFNRAWSAESARRMTEKQAEKERQIKTQLNELHKQTVNLI